RQPARAHRTSPHPRAARSLASDGEGRTPRGTPRTRSPASAPGRARNGRRRIQMNRNLKWIWAAALLLSPLAASAQSPKTDPGAGPPAVAPAAPADDDDGMWLADLFGAGDAIESAFDTPDPAPVALGEIGDAPDAPGAPGPMTFDDDGGPGEGHGPNAHRGGPG